MTHSDHSLFQHVAHEWPKNLSFVVNNIFCIYLTIGNLVTCMETKNCTQPPVRTRKNAHASTYMYHVHVHKHIFTCIHTLHTSCNRTLNHEAWQIGGKTGKACSCTTSKWKSQREWGTGPETDDQKHLRTTGEDYKIFVSIFTDILPYTDKNISSIARDISIDISLVASINLQAALRYQWNLTVFWLHFLRPESFCFWSFLHQSPANFTSTSCSTAFCNYLIYLCVSFYL